VNKQNEADLFAYMHLKLKTKDKIKVNLDTKKVEEEKIAQI
jgi:hypothetical protein